jgi:hypothetical protein
MNLFCKHNYKKLGKYYKEWLECPYNHFVSLWMVNQCINCGKIQFQHIQTFEFTSFDRWYEYNKQIESLGYKTKRLLAAELEMELK